MPENDFAAGDMVFGKAFASGAYRLSDMASNEEVSAVNPSVAFKAKESRVGGTVEKRFSGTKFANPSFHFYFLFLFCFPPEKKRRERMGVWEERKIQKEKRREKRNPSRGGVLKGD